MLHHREAVDKVILLPRTVNVPTTHNPSVVHLKAQAHSSKPESLSLKLYTWQPLNRILTLPSSGPAAATLVCGRRLLRFQFHPAGRPLGRRFVVSSSLNGSKDLGLGAMDLRLALKDGGPEFQV